MKRTYLILIIMILSVNMTSGVKIKKNDTWTYTDSEGTEYEEEAIDSFQLETSDGAISVIHVNTTRPFSFPYLMNISNSELNASMELNLTSSTNGLFITQQGGIVLYPDGEITGLASVTFNDVQYDFDTSNTTYKVIGDPSLTLESTSSDKFTIITQLMKYDDMNGTHTTMKYVSLTEKFVISTDNELKDNVKNFTISRSQLFIEFNYIYSYPDNINQLLFQYTETPDNYNYRIIKDTDQYTYDSGPLKLNNIFTYATLITIDSDYIVPTLVRQIEPVSIVSGLSLSDVREYKYVSYILDKEIETITSTSSDISNNIEEPTESEEPYPLLFSIIPVMLIIIRRKTLNK